jgi:hypothetical protein
MPRKPAPKSGVRKNPDHFPTVIANIGEAALLMIADMI